MKTITRDQWIDRFQREAVPVILNHYGPAKIIYFGSRATGTATEESDIDVIIISEKFAIVPFIRRMENILKAIRFPRHVDALCYTPEEFERVKSTSTVIENALAGSLQTDDE